MTSEILTEQEIQDLTGFALANRQIDALRAAGFSRARRRRDGKVILERAHYDAVCRGQFGQVEASGQDRSAAVNTSFFKRRATA